MVVVVFVCFFFFFQAEDGIRDDLVTGVQTCALPIWIAISWHELPLLGPQSVLVARAAEAAALQGGYAAFYRQMLADGFRPSPAWIARVAEAAGLDGARVRRNMDGDAVAARLLASARAARTLGFIGTPGLAVGRSAVLGALGTDQMEDLISDVA